MDRLFTDTELAPGVRFHGRRSDLRKTDRLVIAWVGQLDETDVTERAVLPSVMLRGTKSHPDRTAVNQHLEHLFGSSVSAGVMKSGRRHVIYVRAEFPSDRFLEESERIRAQVLGFVGEVLHAPHFDGNAFPTAVVDAELAAHRKQLEALIDDRASYASRRLVEEMHPGDPFRLPEFGRVEDLERIDGASLFERWKVLHSTSPVHIYFGGSVDPDEIAGELGPLIGERGQVADLAPLGDLPSAPSKPKDVVETLDVQQAILALGYRTQCRLGDDNAVAMAFMNGIFGAMSHSKLFQNVREKASLCYSIHSGLDRAQGTLTAQAGVSPDKVSEARKLIEKQLEDIRNGEIDREDEFEATRLAYQNRLEILEDSVASLISTDLTWRLVDAEFSFEEYRRKLLGTTFDEVVEAARTVEPDTCYVLRPEAATGEGAS